MATSIAKKEESVVASVIALRKANAARQARRPAEQPLAPATSSFAEALLGRLEQLGVRSAFGMVGGAIAPLCHALALSGLETFHFRHEGGAGFAAVEAYPERRTRPGPTARRG